MVSRKQLLEEEQTEKRSKTLEHLEEGSVLTGVVKNLTEYGAFVDLGGIDGLLHITDMSWGRLTHPARSGQCRRSDSGQGSEVRQRQAARFARIQAAHARSVARCGASLSRSARTSADA